MGIIDTINNFRDSTKSWLDLLIRLLVVVLIVFGIAWLGVSIYANFQEYNFTEIKNDVSVEKAAYEFRITTTGEVLLCQDFDCTAFGDRLKYVLHGYYKIIGDKWKYNKADLTLDERYFGTINWQFRY